jgi:transcription initiation factor TFIIB
VSKKVLGQCYKVLEQAFNLTPDSSAARAGATGVACPEDLLVRYCNHLDFPPHVQVICKDIVVAREHGIADGRSPVSIAGGAIYFACLLLGVSKAVKDISAVACVSEGTIKLVYRLYYVDRQKLVKDEWIKEGKVIWIASGGKGIQKVETAQGFKNAYIAVVGEIPGTLMS